MKKEVIKGLGDLAGEVLRGVRGKAISNNLNTEDTVRGTTHSIFDTITGALGGKGGVGGCGGGRGGGQGGRGGKGDGGARGRGGGCGR